MTMNATKTRILGAAALLALICLDAKALAQPMTGSVNQDGWSFLWNLTSTSGVRITNLYRNGVFYMATGSLPAIRVQYNNDSCGPFLDRIKWDNVVADGAGNKV